MHSMYLLRRRVLQVTRNISSVSSSNIQTIGKNQVIVLSDVQKERLYGVSLNLCSKIGGELVFADKQIAYKHLTVGSFKPSKENTSRVPHHMLDMYELTDEIVDRDHVKLIAAKVEEIMKRGKTPVLIGSHNVWNDMLMKGLPSIPPLSLEHHAKAAELLRDAKASGDWNRGCSILKEVNSSIENITNTNDWQRLRQKLAAAIQLNEISKDRSDNTVPSAQLPRVQLLPDVDFRHFFISQDRRSLRKDLDFGIEKLLRNGLLEEVADLLENNLLTLDAYVASSMGYKNTIDYLLRKDFKPNDLNAFIDYIQLMSKGIAHSARNLCTKHRNGTTSLYLRLGNKSLNYYRAETPPSTGRTFVNQIVAEIIHWTTTSSPEQFKVQILQQIEEGSTFTEVMKTGGKFPLTFSFKNHDFGNPAVVRYLMCRLYNMKKLRVPSNLMKEQRENCWIGELFDEASGVTPSTVPDLDNPQWTAEEFDIRASTDYHFVKSYCPIWSPKLTNLISSADNLRNTLEKNRPDILQNYWNSKM